MAGVERTVETLMSATSARPLHPLTTVTGEQRRYGMAAPRWPTTAPCGPPAEAP